MRQGAARPGPSGLGRLNPGDAAGDAALAAAGRAGGYRAPALGDGGRGAAGLSAAGLKTAGFNVAWLIIVGLTVARLAVCACVRLRRPKPQGLSPPRGGLRSPKSAPAAGGFNAAGLTDAGLTVAGPKSAPTAAAATDWTGGGGSRLRSVTEPAAGGGSRPPPVTEGIVGYSLLYPIPSTSGSACSAAAAGTVPVLTRCSGTHRTIVEVKGRPSGVLYSQALQVKGPNILGNQSVWDASAQCCR